VTGEPGRDLPEALVREEVTAVEALDTVLAERVVPPAGHHLGRGVGVAGAVPGDEVPGDRFGSGVGAVADDEGEIAADDGHEPVPHR
jgi:hypothetical protein